MKFGSLHASFFSGSILITKSGEMFSLASARKLLSAAITKEMGDHFLSMAVSYQVKDLLQLQLQDCSDLGFSTLQVFG